MGLDMYLEKHIYVGAQFEHRNVTGEISIKVDGTPLPVDFNKVSELIEVAGYWRKANAIHQWFVDNVQGGEDNGGTYYVHTDQLEQLLADVNHVLEHPAEADEILPTQSGFFFGSKDYDKWYFQDLKETKEILENALKDSGKGFADYYYHASW